MVFNHRRHRGHGGCTEGFILCAPSVSSVPAVVKKPRSSRHLRSFNGFGPGRAPSGRILFYTPAFDFDGFVREETEKMLSWYRERVREHGASAATGLLARVVWSRGATALANRLLAGRVVCPCCGWAGRKFYDFLEIGCTARDAECPRCNSHPRHRAFAVWLRRVYELEKRTGVALVFAPERALEELWAEAKNLVVVKTDIEPSRGVDLLADIQRLPFADRSFDLIWCQHVLTQISDDRAAIREMTRVLRRAPAGELIVSVAQGAGARTREFGRADKNHLGFWRIYGADFTERLEEAGLEVRRVGYGLSAEECARYGIDSDEGFFICTRAASV